MGKFMYKDQPYGGTTNYASAINCVDKDGNESTIQAEIDELNDKLDDCFQSVSDGKSLVASAITDKGIDTDATATFETIADNIRNIETGVDISDTTAIPSQVSLGFIFYDKDGNRCVGTRPAIVNTQTGSQSVGFMGGQAQSVSYTIQFPQAFDVIPTITFSPAWTSNGGWVDSIKANNVTKTGFTLYVSSRGGGDTGKGIVGTITWYASTV